LSTGSGKFDFWTSSLLGTSDVVESPLPTVSQYPSMAFYTLPDSAKTTVSSFSCSPNIITVANFNNRQSYYDVDSILRFVTEPVGKIGNSSSLGPDRRGGLKPDIGATGNTTIGPNAANIIAANMASTPANRAKVALGAMHRTNGGTSMASPVVAGVTALYLQKCPNATMVEIKAAIASTAKQDIYTGTTPNFVFGNGKIDGFAALTNSNFSLGSDKDICQGDSVQISSTTFSSYLWSTGDTLQNIYVDTTMSIYLTGTNNSGCKSKSDTLNVTIHPLPTKPIINVVGNDSLLYSTNLNLQWYYNTSVIVGANDTLHIAQNNGDYYVEVTDSFGCKNTSDTINVILLGIENTIINTAKIFPNPTTGKLKIELTDNSIKSVAIINLLGEILINQRVTSSKIEFNLDGFADGVYYARLSSKDSQYLQKLILLR